MGTNDLQWVPEAAMDHGLYQYEPITSRVPLQWPQNKRIALIVLLHLEYWQEEPPAEARRDARFVGEYGSFSPDYRTWSQREYGNRVGLARVLSVLDRYGVKLSVPLNAACVGRHDTLIKALQERGAEFLGHGTAANHIISSEMSEETERAVMQQSLDAVERACGVRPTGWAGQSYGESARTPAILSQAGLNYVLDWPNDDAPYLMHTDGRSLVSIPRQPEWDDVEQLWLRRISMPRYPELIGDAYETLREEGGRVLVLSLHPWLIGMAHRISYLDRVLQRITGDEDVWYATAGEVAQHARMILQGGDKQ